MVTKQGLSEAVENCLGNNNNAVKVYGGAVNFYRWTNLILVEVRGFGRQLPRPNVKGEGVEVRPLIEGGWHLLLRGQGQHAVAVVSFLIQALEVKE